MLTQVDIRQVWDTVRPQLEYVKEIRGGTWRPEDVYAACVYGVADLYVDDKGFVILRPMVDDYSRERFLLVWMAYGEGYDFMDRNQAQVVALARANGFTKLQFWRKARGNYESKGFHKEFTIYEMELD